MGHLFTYVSGQRTTVTLGSIQQAGTDSQRGRNCSKLFLGTPDLDPRLALTGDPNALNRDFAHYFDASKVRSSGLLSRLRRDRATATT